MGTMFRRRRYGQHAEDPWMSDEPAGDAPTETMTSLVVRDAAGTRPATWGEAGGIVTPHGIVPVPGPSQFPALTETRVDTRWEVTQTFQSESRYQPQPPPPPAPQPKPRRPVIHPLPADLPPRYGVMPDVQAAAMIPGVRYPAYRYGGNREGYAAAMRIVDRLTGTTGTLEADLAGWRTFTLPVKADAPWDWEFIEAVEMRQVAEAAELAGKQQQGGGRHARH